MLEKIKRKRLSLTSNIQGFPPRSSSKQKRKTIEANLQKFKKDVFQSKPLSSINTISHSPDISKNSIQSQSSILTTKQHDNIKHTQQILSPRFKSSTDLRNNIKFKNIRNSVQQNHINQQQKTNINTIQKLTNNIPQIDKIIEQNLQDSNLQKSQQLQHSSTLKQFTIKPTRHISFGCQSLQKSLPNSHHQIFKQPTNQLIKIQQQPTHSKKQQQQNSHFRLDTNQSKLASSSSNASSAIFYTSQFKQYINRDQPTSNTQHQQPQLPTNPQTSKPLISDPKMSKSPYPPQKQFHMDKQITQSFLKIGEQQLSQLTSQKNIKLQHIQSGKSLAFSNNDQSLLKIQHINQQQKYVQDIINIKLQNQLVMEIQQFRNNFFTSFIYKYLSMFQSQFINQICKYFKLLKNIQQFINNNITKTKRYYFDGFIINKQYKYQQIKSTIQIQNFIKYKNFNLIKSIFNHWKNYHQYLQQIIQQKNKNKQIQCKKNIFQIFRIIWYQQKVKNQTDLYYLSKLFTGWRTAIHQSLKSKQTLSLKHYCRHLKHKYFKKIVQGTQSLKKSKANLQLAQSHYQYLAKKKYFDQWLSLLQKKPTYIQLVVTNKNIFKQTGNHKWMGIKTVDFKEIKE